MIPTSAPVRRINVVRDHSVVAEYETDFEIVGDFAPRMIAWIERQDAAFKQAHKGLSGVTVEMGRTLIVRFRWNALANRAHGACTEAVVARILEVGANMESRVMMRQGMSRSGSDASTDTHGSY